METRETISVTMTAGAMRTIRQAVASGEFASAADALEDAVRVWRQRNQASPEMLDALRARVRRSIDDPRPSLSSAEARAEMDHFMNARMSMPRHAAD